MTVTINGTSGITTPSLSSGNGVAATNALTGATLNTSGAATVGGILNANGGQIKFPASQNPSSDANTLDDYEEGSWTPIYVGSVTNPTITYGSQDGRYIKVGRLVFIEANIHTMSASGGSGVLNLGGLPFTVGSGVNDIGISIGLTAYWGTAPTLGGIQANSTVIALFNTPNTNLSVSALGVYTSQNYLRFQASYIASA